VTNGNGIINHSGLDRRGNVTRVSSYTDAGAAAVWTVTETPESIQPAIRKTIAGRTVLTVSSTAVTNAYTYDGFGRQVSATDGRGNTSLTVYNDLGQVAYTVDAAGNRTSYAYDGLGRKIAVTDPLTNTTHIAYDSAGNVTAQWGAVYPVAYEYDTAGRMTALSTTRDGETWDTTRWLYDHATGLVTNKVYADGSRIGYTHTPDGKPLRTTWARGVWKENAYDALGQLANVSYSDATPDVSLTRNAFGTVTNAADASGFVHGFAVNDRQSVTNETVISDVYTNTLTRLLDAFDRPAGLLLDSGYSLFCGRDSERRVSAVSNAAFTARYAYTSGYVTGHTLTFSNNNTLARAMTRDQHRPNLTTGITNFFNGASVSSLAYAHDIAGRVTNRNDGAFCYNERSEVTNAVLGADNYAYGYDAIGNRVWSAANTLTNSYAANSLNQYTAVTPSVAVAYDADGNMTRLGDWRHTWDAENRLVQSQPYGLATNGAVMVDNRYDHRHRRCSKTVRRLSGRGAGYPFDPSQAGTWDVVETRTFIYDGWNLVRETVSRTDGVTDVFDYFWGLDISGTLQGAGGVGGLLAVRVNNAWFFPLYDANGNVTVYVDGSGTVRAHYEYSPFGEIIEQSGDLANTFTHRFSTKPFDAETGLLYYDYRYYNPGLGRLISRPMTDETTVAGYVRNLYNFTEKEFQHLYIGFDTLELLPGTPLASVGCNITGSDGEPMFNSENNDNNVTRKCTALHEYQHIKDRQFCCQKAREAYRKTGNATFVQQRWNAHMRLTRDWSECRAYEKSLSCAKKMKCKVPKEKKKWLENYIEESEKRKKEHCGKSTGPTPCPF